MKHRQECIVFLATLLDTTPEILAAMQHDDSTFEALQVQRQLDVCERFADVMEQKGRAK